MQRQRFPLRNHSIGSDLALLLMLILGLVLAQPAQAATTVPPGYGQGWGWNHVGELNIPAALSDVIAGSASQIHSLALKSNGTVVTWGSTVFFPFNGKARSAAADDEAAVTQQIFLPLVNR